MEFIQMNYIFNAQTKIKIKNIHLFWAIGIHIFNKIGLVINIKNKILLI